MNLPTYAPPDTDLAAPFWDAVEQGEIRLPRCSVCQRWQWYPSAAGADCAGGELLWEPVAHTGTVHTFTRVERAFLPGGQADVPFVVGFVELDGVEGVRLVSNLVDDDVRVGMRVGAEFLQHAGRTHLIFREDTNA
jgi:uncharacterized OB-fold protein